MAKTKTELFADIDAKVGTGQQTTGPEMNQILKDHFESTEELKENAANKKTVLNDSDTEFPTSKAVLAKTVQIVNQKTSWPLAQTSQCLNPNFPFETARRFLVDMYLEGVRDPTKQYSVAVIKRNRNEGEYNVWQVRVFSETPVESSLPSVFNEVARLSTAVNPENGDNITIHTLSKFSPSEISGKVAVRWSVIPDGIYIQNNWASGSVMCRLDDEIFNKEKSVYIRNAELSGIEETVSGIEETVSGIEETVSGIEEIKKEFTSGYEYDSATSEITPSFINGNNRTSPFSGWGAVFNKAGVSFNVLRLESLRRLSTVPVKWKYIRAFVKNDKSDATLIAISPFIELDEDSDSISEVLLPLTDPTTGEFVTLDDSNFSGSTYFLGYIFYDTGKNIAYGGETRGTQENYAGLSYYNTTINHQSWSSFTSNACVPFEHILAINVQKVARSIEVEELKERVTTLENEIGISVVEISLPDKIYAIVGDTLQLFYRGMIKAPNPYIYDILISCSKGKQYPRYFEYLPVSGDAGTTTLKVEVKNKDGIILGTKTCSLITKAVVQSPSVVKKILCVGDSLTSAGTWVIEAVRRLTGTGGLPSGFGLSNIQFVGRKNNGAGIGWEGNGGWTWGSYATAGAAAYRFFVTEVVTPPAIGSVYTNNGGTFTVAEINITGGEGNIRCTSVGTPTASGILTKSSGAGDATITFTSSELDAGNPFWDDELPGLNFPAYVNTYCGGSVDAVYFLLTWNGVSANQTDFTSMITTAKVLVDHIHTNYPACLIKIMGIQVPSLNGGMGANYGATGTGYADTFGMVKTALNLNKAYQDWCNEAAYSFMEFVNVSSQFDSENNMPETDKAVNTRSSKTEKIGTNGVHPALEGYYQIADVLFRNVVANFC